MKTKTVRYVVFAALAALIGWFGIYQGIYRLGFCRVWIGADELGVVISRVGADVAPGQVLAEAGQRGVRREVLGTGRHFIDPFNERVEKYPLSHVGAGREPRVENGIPIPGSPPEIGVVVSFVGDPLPQGEFLANPGQKGIQRKVLTPGVYRINPYAARVENHPATIIDAGYVGVITHKSGEPTQLDFANNTQRGVIRDPLPAGLYYLNPYEFQVARVKVGYRELSFAAEHAITFPASDGHTIRLEATIVWGLHPADAPHIVKQFGDENAVVDNSIRPQVESKVRVVGSRFTSREIVEGASRERFQAELFRQLSEQLEAQHVRVLAALVRDVDVPEVVRRPIQSSRIANEEAETNRVKTETAKISTELNEIKGALVVEAARVHAETEKLAQEEAARGNAELERLRAETKSQIAARLSEAAKLKADTRKVLGQAEADSASLLSRAESDGLRSQIAPFGDPNDYGLWRFAAGLPDTLQIQLRDADPKNPQSDLIEALRAIAGALAKPK
jgi:regulator of protease activity HflC (stomatin/prohibitin superfamily)